MKLYRMAEGGGALKKRPWTFVRGDPKGRPHFICERCGDTYVANVPIPVDLFAALCGAWGKTHRRCKPTSPSPLKSRRPFLDHAIAEARRIRKRETTPRPAR